MPSAPELHPWAALAVGIAAVAAIALVALVAQVLTGRRRWTSGRASLFLTLCRAHQIVWRDRWLLWKLARVRAPDEPARLFLDPRLLAAGAAAPPALAQRLEALRQRLFAGLNLSEDAYGREKQQVGQR